jgi:hypothetical protein
MFKLYIQIQSAFILLGRTLCIIIIIVTQNLADNQAHSKIQPILERATIPLFLDDQNHSKYTIKITYDLFNPMIIFVGFEVENACTADLRVCCFADF